ncbi:hypothetical protein AA0113_g5971 [Alternaria arborescens]|uniref:Uncharacterized protein n=1 Tax=Alternaria arborescens TaxID=156630 RepID=A0A4Q4S0X6_9PLEO|nr:hypothetical protein AA0111_g5347 [Alternaria arborescens]RYO30899.1 hypothetical protein AA0111_g5347 [Alternaria arborescens]RYO63435.1 hypothetical protein AA0113_g5971 [Alternaria arborescens]
MTSGPLLRGEDADDAKNTEPLPMAPMPIFANMAIQGGRGITKTHQPVHETMTIAALIASKFPMSEGTTYKNAPKEIKEFVRGSVWNDDPGCLLFEKDTHDNYRLSDGTKWFKEYESAEGGLLGGFVGWITGTPRQTITGRSHFGDLQFLHAMAAQEREEPQETKEKIMMWLEIMYKLSVGDQGIHENMRLDQIDVSSSSRYQLRMFFKEDTSPSGGETLLPLKMKPGVADRWGKIENFHTYRGQSSDHGHYDHSNVQVEEWGNLGDLDKFNGMIGVRDGIDACITLANYWHDRVAWENGVETWLRDTVFALAEDVTRANHEV